MALTKEQQKIILGAGILFVACSVLGYFLYYPKLSQWWAFSSELKKVSQKLDEANTKAQSYSMIRTQLEKDKQDLMQIKSKFPAEAEMPLVQQQLAQLARQLNLKISLMNRQATMEGQIYHQTPLEINLQGAYQPIAQFLDELNRLKWLVTVQKFQIHSVDPKPLPGSQKMALAIILNIFTYTLSTSQ